jgi:integrase
MPRLTKSLPTYRKHKVSGQAVVTINGKDIYLGLHGTKASRIEYDRLIGEYLAGGRRLTRADEPTINEVMLAFLKHAACYYRKPALNADGSKKLAADGSAVTEPTTELRNLKRALRPLHTLYGRLPAFDFGPLALKAVRDEMIRRGWCRRSVNGNVARIRQLFKWATENELVSPTVYHGLLAVSGLRAGRCGAPESDPVRPVSEHILSTTLPHLSRHVKTMVELQLLTGMRPGELCSMRSCDVDTTGNLWDPPTSTPDSPKNSGGRYRAMNECKRT